MIRYTPDHKRRILTRKGNWRCLCDDSVSVYAFVYFTHKWSKEGLLIWVQKHEAVPCFLDCWTVVYSVIDINNGSSSVDNSYLTFNDIDNERYCSIWDKYRDEDVADIMDYRVDGFPVVEQLIKEHIK